MLRKLCLTSLGDCIRTGVVINSYQTHPDPITDLFILSHRSMEEYLGETIRFLLPFFWKKVGE